MLVLYLVMMLTTRRFEDVHIPSKTTSIIEDISVGSDTLIFDDDYVSYEATSEVVDAIVESGTPLTIDVHVRDTNNSAPELVECSVSSQIFRYSFFTPLIEDKIDHETTDRVVTFSGLSESPHSNYGFRIVPTESCSESSEFLTMIQQMVSSAFFTDCLEFIPGSSLLLAEFDVCYSRHSHISFFIVKSYA